MPPDDDSRKAGGPTALPALAAALANLPDAAEVTDRTGRLLYVNRAFEQLLGYTSEEVLGRTPAELFRGGTRSPAFYDSVFEGLLRGEPWSGVLESRRKDGSLIALEISVSPISGPGGVVEHLLAIRRDISERMRSEEAIRESEARWRTVFERNPAVKLLIDPETGRIVKANEEAAALYGWSPAELVKMRIQEINVADEAEVFAEMAAARAERRRHFRFVHRLRSGEHRRVEVFTGPIRFGSRTLLLSIVHDVTDREHALERLLAAEARERRLVESLHRSLRMSALGRLAGGLAHDFNNLLFVVLGSTQLLREELPEPVRDGALDHLARIEAASDRAADRVRQLMLFSRGGGESPGNTDVGDAAENMAQLLEAELGPHVGVDRVVEAGAFASIAPADLEAIIVQLVGNAAEAMTRSGRISLRVRGISLDEPTAALARVEPGRYAELSVEDDGVGMSADELEHAFEPFFTTKEANGQVGLGLAVVYGLVHNARGSVTAEARPQGGTRIRVLLPAPADEARPAGPTLAGPSAARPTARAAVPKLLVVDDQAPVRDVLVGILERAGYRTVSTTCAAEALELLHRNGSEVDLVLTDVQMPGMSGVELAAAIAQAWPDLPVLLVSGHPGDAIARGAPASDLLAKPFSRNELLAMVANRLSR